MYFENVLLNVLIIILFLSIFTILNNYLNRHNRFFTKYSSSLKMNTKEIVDKYAFDENIKLDSFPSKANNDLDTYLKNSNAIFINSRHYFHTSIYTLARTIYFCSMSKVSDCCPLQYKIQRLLDTSLILLDVLAHGLIMIGLLLKINLLIIIGLIYICFSFVFNLICLKTVKEYYKESINYLTKVLSDDKEIESIKIIYRYELILYILRPFLSMIKLFPFLLSSNQKKEDLNKKYYEE